MTTPKPPIDVSTLREGETSPGPWELVPANENHGAYITNVFGGDVCDLYTMSNPASLAVCNGGDSKPIPFADADANAAFIVRACNSHYEMLEALRSLCDQDAAYVGETIRIRCDSHGDAVRRMRLAREAIAKAGA